MKKLLFSLLLLSPLAGALSSCREQSKIPEPSVESIPLILPEINPAKSYFAYAASRNSVNTAASTNTPRPVFEFVVNPSQGYAELQTVEVYKCFRRGINPPVFGPRVKVADLTSFPATVSINSQDALTDLYLSSPTTANPTPTSIKASPQSPSQANRILNNGDAVVFTFEYVMKDGRRIVLTPLSTADGSVGVPTGNQIFAPYAAVAEFRL